MGIHVVEVFVCAVRRLTFSGLRNRVEGGKADRYCTYPRLEASTACVDHPGGKMGEDVWPGGDLDGEVGAAYDELDGIECLM